MFKKILIILLFGTSVMVSGQETVSGTTRRARNAVQLSFGGAGVYFSLTYERLLITGPAWNGGVKTGLGTSISSALSPPEFSLPLGGFVLYGKGNSKLDLGLSFTGYMMWQHDLESDGRFMELQPLIIPSLAYRFQKNAGGWMFRAGLSSIIHINSTTPAYSPWMDLGVGYGF